MSAPDSGAGVLVERDGPIAWLRMNRPDALNAFDAPMIDAMRAALSELERDDDVRAAILCGEGRAFSTGIDVKALAGSAIGPEYFEQWDLMSNELDELRFPLIGAAHGHCLGGGLMLLLQTDYRLAADDLSIGLGAVRHGILPGTAPRQLVASVGVAVARRLCLFCEAVDADEALTIGLVDRVVPAEQLEAEAHAVAERVAHYPRVAVEECKRLVLGTPSFSRAEYDAAYFAGQQRCLDALGSEPG
jgi:enoyl-CoA hydratase/carnithine racemase